MSAKRLAMSDHATWFAARPTRALIGASVLTCLFLAELLASLVLQGSQ